jgi:septal ring factor EnvC (AmiA/AmiB activator)
MEIDSIISLAISAVMMIVGVTTFVITQSRQSKKDTEESTRQLSDIREDIVGVRMKIEEVGNIVKETKDDVKGLSANLSDIDKRLTRVEENLKTAFKRIDELKESKADKED